MDKIIFISVIGVLLGLIKVLSLIRQKNKQKKWEAVHSEEFKRFYRAVGNLPYLKKYDGAGKLREDLLSPDTPEGWKKEISFALDKLG